MDIGGFNVAELPLPELLALDAVLKAAIAAMTASPGLTASLMMDDEAATLVLSAEVTAE